MARSADLGAAGGERPEPPVGGGVAGRTRNVVSDRLNSRAIARIRASLSPSASGTTASGLPVSGSSAKTSTIEYFCSTGTTAASSVGLALASSL